MAATTRARSELKMPGTPPRWVNGLMRGLLRTPGIRAVLGTSFAEIAVTGARTGRTYRTPVQYLRHDGDIVVLSQQTRRWWRNLAAEPEVELLLRGRTVRAHATVLQGAVARPVVDACLRAAPRVARYYGLGVTDDGTVDPDGIGELLERVVAIVATPEPQPDGA